MSNNPALWHNKNKMIYQKWQKPTIPSNDDIENYYILLKKVKPKRILILGSTPLIRDLMSKFKAEIVIADISLDMIMSMSELMKNKKQINQEIWIKANWLEMPLEEKSFDAVLGDFVIENVPIDLWPKLFQKISCLLKKNGVFITRIGFIHDYDLKKTARSYIEGKISLHEFYFSSYHSTYDKNQSNDLVKMKNRMFKHYKKISTNIKEFSKFKTTLNQLYPGKKQWWIFKDKQDLSLKIKKYFLIGEMLFANDYFTSKNSPVVLLKSRS